jgi:hypothetical protein
MAGICFRTHRRLWALAAARVFAALGFVDVTAGVGKGDNRFWTNVARLALHDYHGNSAEAVSIVALQALVLAAPGLLLGWALQAAIVLLRSLGSGLTSAGGGALHILAPCIFMQGGCTFIPNTNGLPARVKPIQRAVARCQSPMRKQITAMIQMGAVT